MNKFLKQEDLNQIMNKGRAIFNSVNYFRSLLQNDSIDEEKSRCLHDFLLLSTTQELADSAEASLMSKYSRQRKQR